MSTDGLKCPQRAFYARNGLLYLRVPNLPAENLHYLQSASFTYRGASYTRRGLLCPLRGLLYHRGASCSHMWGEGAMLVYLQMGLPYLHRCLVCSQRASCPIEGPLLSTKGPPISAEGPPIATEGPPLPTEGLLYLQGASYSTEGLLCLPRGLL